MLTFKALYNNIASKPRQIWKEATVGSGLCDINNFRIVSFFVVDRKQMIQSTVHR